MLGLYADQQLISFLDQKTMNQNQNRRYCSQLKPKHLTLVNFRLEIISNELRCLRAWFPSAPSMSVIIVETLSILVYNVYSTIFHWISTINFTSMRNKNRGGQTKTWQNLSSQYFFEERNKCHCSSAFGFSENGNCIVIIGRIDCLSELKWMKTYAIHSNKYIFWEVVRARRYCVYEYTFNKTASILVIVKRFISFHFHELKWCVWVSPPNRMRFHSIARLDDFQWRIFT